MTPDTKNSASRRRVPVLAALALVTCCLAAQNLEAQVRSGAAFLRVIPGTRQQGVAGSVTGAIDELYAVYANPGAAGFLREWQWSATYVTSIADFYSASFFYARQIRTPWPQRARVGLSLGYQGMPDFDSSQGATPAASASDLVVAASIGQPFTLYGRRLAIGANLRYLDSQLAQYEARSWSADVGLLYRSARFAFIKPGSGFFDYGIVSAGIALTHLGGDMKFISTGTPLPRTVRAGVAFNTGTHNGLQVQLAADYRDVRGEPGTFGIGTEISWNQAIALRAGYDFDDDLLSHFAFGLSWRLDDHTTSLGHYLPGRNNALRFDLAGSQDPEVFTRPYRGSVTHYPIGPESFRLLTPAAGAIIESDSVVLSWQPSSDPDLYDQARFWLVVDPDSARLAQTLKRTRGNGDEMLHRLENAPLFLSRKMQSTELALTGLSGRDYFWTVVAYDLDSHVRFAGNENNPIRHFRIVRPDLEITGIEFEYSPWITEDDFQGFLRVAISNRGDRAANRVTIALHDSMALATAQPVVETSMTDIPAGASDTLRVEWHTQHAGLHHLIARVDPDHQIAESDDGNNERIAAFYTIPKGRFATGDTVVAARLSRIAFQVPFIPEVCFARNSSEVPPAYIRTWAFEPTLVTLAGRLRGNRNLKITLHGFADPNSGELDAGLGDRRAAAVRDSLFRLGVMPEQIKLFPGQVLPPRRMPTDPDDARWVLQERRCVAIRADSASEAVIFELVSFDDVEPLPLPIPFEVDITGAVRLTDGRIELTAGQAKEEINIRSKLERTRLVNRIDWPHDQNKTANELVWSDRNMRYQLALVDSLGREFRTRPAVTFLQAQTLLREQRVALPIVFKGTAPLYDFYWSKLITQAVRMLSLDNMRMRFSGHACAIGPEAVNARLSQQRADAFRQDFLQNVRRQHPEVYDEIVRRLDPSAGFGEKRPLAIERLNGETILIGDNESPLGRKLNRRLELQFYFPVESLSAR